MASERFVEHVQASVLIVDSDIASRHVIADYLRDCGYAVVEAVNTDEAYLALGEPTLSIDVILFSIIGSDTRNGFEFAHWVRANRPDLEVKLVGSAETTADAAADLCESGPLLRKPYEPERIIEYITQLRAKRNRADGSARST